MLNSVYNDVIMKLTGDDSNNAAKGINLCNKSVVRDEDELNFAADEFLYPDKIITREFRVNSTCPSDIIISTLLLHFSVLIFISLI